MAVEAKPAATVVLMRDRDARGGGPEVLLVERHGRAAFGPGAFVFPGGALDPQDTAPGALALSAHLSPREAGARMPDVTPPERALAYFIAAIRETFEETLVLLAYRDEGGRRTPPRFARETLARVRERVHGGALRFTDWVARNGLALATEQLVYFAHWITPEPLPQRFAARFFLVAVPHRVAVATDRREVVTHRWLRPAEALALREAGEIRLMDPTVRNLERLAAFASTREALAALRGREVEPVLPKLRTRPDGSRTIIYPWQPEYHCA